MFEIKKTFLLLAILSLMGLPARAQTGVSGFMDPEVQNFFETAYGYKKDLPPAHGSFRDSPISINGNMFEKASSVKSALGQTSRLPSSLISVNFDSLPLYYDLKVVDTAGPISSFVLEPRDNMETAVQRYALVDITLEENGYENFFSQAVPALDFRMAGEETYRSGKRKIRAVFGWLPVSKIQEINDFSFIKSYSLSKRDGVTAPVKNISMVIKVPANRKPEVFSEAFLKEMGKAGFVKRSIESVNDGSSHRFSFLKIDGTLPVDKLDLIIRNPFVFKIRTGI